jgi:hypothetical protein
VFQKLKLVLTKEVHGRKYTRRQITAFGITVVILVLLFSPYPGVSAVNVLISNTDIGNTDTEIKLNVEVNEPSAITLPDGGNSETLPSNLIIRVIVDPGTSNERVALFDINGVRLSNSLLLSGQTADTGIISELHFDAVQRVSTGAYGNLGYGNFYGYGFGMFSGVASYGTIGNGTNVYGLTSNEFNDDTVGKYTLTTNPALLSSGPHVIRVDILDQHDDTDFFSSGNISFSNSFTGTAAAVTVPSGGETFTPPSTTTTLTVTTNSLPKQITASANQKLDFTNAPSKTTVGGTTTVTLTTQQSTTTSSVAGKSVSVVFPPNVVASASSAWDNTISVPTVSSVTPPNLEGVDETAGVVFSVGSGNTRITFDQAIQITIPGEGGKKAFFSGTTSSGSVQTVEITTTCTANSQAAANAQLSIGGIEECLVSSSAGSDMVIWTKHFSSFGSFSTSSTGGGPGGGSQGTGPSRGGGGGGGGGGGAATGFAGIISPFRLVEVSYDVCTENMAKVTITSSDPERLPSVKLRTSFTGIVQAKLAENQPYAEQNKLDVRNAKYVFEAPLKEDTFFMVIVEDIANRNVAQIKKTVNMPAGQCTYKETIAQPTLPKPSAKVGTEMMEAGGIISDLLTVATPLVVQQFAGSSLMITNDDTGERLVNYQTMQSSPDRYAEIVLGIKGQTTTTIAMQDRFGREDSNNNANVFLQISHTGTKINSMRGVELGGDGIMIIAGDGSKVELPKSAEIGIPSSEPEKVSKKTIIKVNEKSKVEPTPSAVRDFLNKNIELTNQNTGEILTNYVMIQTVQDKFAEKELGIKGQFVTTLAFPDRYGRDDSNNDLNVFLQISHTEEKVNSLRGIQLGGDKIGVIVNGVDQGQITQTSEVPLSKN